MTHEERQQEYQKLRGQYRELSQKISEAQTEEESIQATKDFAQSAKNIVDFCSRAHDEETDEEHKKRWGFTRDYFALTVQTYSIMRSGR